MMLSEEEFGSSAACKAVIIQFAVDEAFDSKDSIDLIDSIGARISDSVSAGSSVWVGSNSSSINDVSAAVVSTGKKAIEAMTQSARVSFPLIFITFNLLLIK